MKNLGGHLDEGELRICLKQTGKINRVKGVGAKTQRGFLTATDSGPAPNAMLSPVPVGKKFRWSINLHYLLGHDRSDKGEWSICSKRTGNINRVKRVGAKTQFGFLAAANPDSTPNAKLSPLWGKIMKFRWSTFKIVVIVGGCC